MTGKPSRYSKVSIIVGAYFVLLLASTLIRLNQSDVHPRPDQTTITLPEFDHDHVTGGTVNLSYVDSGGDLPVLFLLHGSPAGSRSLMDIHRALAQTGEFRIITPDLPGFEGSSHWLPDYSFSSHASYIAALMDSLSVSSAHIVAYSMSGGVASVLLHREPDKVSSLVLMSALGVQELELMGDHYLNRSVHALQYGLIWGVTNLIPHFGVFDSFMLGVPYARNFFDSDQRPLRQYLKGFEGPTLILHGRDDALVPYGAALEHHRIIPQSELITFNNVGHGLPFEKPNEVSERIREWIERVEVNDAPTYASADVQRKMEAAAPFDPSQLPPLEGFSLILILFLISASTLLSEDLAAIGAGLMVARGSLTFEAALGAAFVGIFAGDIILYLAGRVLGARIIRLPPFSWLIDRHQLARGKNWFKREGTKVVLISRVLPGSRFPTYVAAGVLKAPFWKFVGLFLIGTIIWTPLIVGLSTIMGSQILSFWAVYESYAIVVFVGLILFVYLLIHVGLPLLNHNGRQRLKAKWGRMVRWEFWPPFIFYPPLITYLLFLAIKFRSLTAFTAANPGIPSGGFVGESKSSILTMLDRSAEHVARFDLIPNPEQAQRKVLAFMQRTGIKFPVVLKPDVGERGNGVLYAHSMDDVAHYVASRPDPAIIQERISGREYGVFFIRHPSESKGSIFSITEKKLISIVGNGKHTLERRILDDDRAKFMYAVFSRRYADQLDRIVPKGEIFQLVDVGTHARGALFLDGNHLISEDLEVLFNQIVGRARGFFFGRFDIKVPSEAHLLSGEDIKIIELNGVTSEATHIYDPHTSLLSAYKTLAKQWKLAFEIGRENMRNGVKPTGITHLCRLIYHFKIKPTRKVDVSEAATR